MKTSSKIQNGMNVIHKNKKSNRKRDANTCCTMNAAVCDLDSCFLFTAESSVTEGVDIFSCGARFVLGGFLDAARTRHNRRRLY